jgi:hypothetical protein
MLKKPSTLWKAFFVLCYEATSFSQETVKSLSNHSKIRSELGRD